MQWVYQHFKLEKKPPFFFFFCSDVAADSDSEKRSFSDSLVMFGAGADWCVSVAAETRWELIWLDDVGLVSEGKSGRRPAANCSLASTTRLTIAVVKC